MKVYIDGENCRKGLARILLEQRLIKKERDLEYYKLKELLTDVVAADNLDINYYASKIKLPNGYRPSKEVMNQVKMIKQYSRKWVPALERQGIAYIKAGSLKVKSTKKCTNCKQSQDVLQEKGVDVRIAVDVFDDVYSKRTDQIIIMSSDTDLCPVLHRVAEKGAKVTYVCFADATNRAVAAVASETVTISTAKVKKYFN